jgi:hypothetical protein
LISGEIVDQISMDHFSSDHHCSKELQINKVG